MYAVIRDGSKQFRVEQDQEIEIERTGLEVGATYSFDVLALTDADGNTTIGTPLVEGATVTAAILREQKQEKLIVFHFRRRKSSRVKRGHRQRRTRVIITSIGVPGAK